MSNAPITMVYLRPRTFQLAMYPANIGPCAGCKSCALGLWIVGLKTYKDADDVDQGVISPRIIC